VQRAADPPGAALGVAGTGDAQRVGVDLDDRPQRGTAPVEGVDAIQVLPGQALGR